MNRNGLAVRAAMVRDRRFEEEREGARTRETIFDFSLAPRLSGIVYALANRAANVTFKRLH